MSLNVGVLTSKQNTDSDEMYTPFYAVDNILKYVNKELVVWCPFDDNWSAFTVSLKENGNRVISTHLNTGHNFFEYEPEYYDLIISNPPFSIKDKVLERLYELNKPFAVLLPLNSLQRKNAVKFYEKGIQILSFDHRCDFHNAENMEEPKKGTPFASAYFCRNFLPKDLIIEHLEKYKRPLAVEKGGKNETNEYV